MRVESWPLIWERVTLQSMGKYRQRWQSQKPYRQCPHGYLYFDEKISPPDVLNSWGIAEERCPRHACQRAIRNYVRQ